MDKQAAGKVVMTIIDDPCTPEQLQQKLREANETIARLKANFNNLRITYQMADKIRDDQENRIAELERRLEAARTQLKEIVCVVPPDDGVILLSDDSPCHYNAERKIQEYDHVHFSPLGDALIALHETLMSKSGHEPQTQREG